MSVEGMMLEGAYHNRMMRDDRYYSPDRVIDLSGIFGAIEAFYTAKFSLNNLRQTVETLQAAIDNAGKKSPLDTQ